MDTTKKEDYETMECAIEATVAEDAHPQTCNGGEDNAGDRKVETESEEEARKSLQRAKWDSKLQFLFMVVGYAVGLSNIWRFPYLMQRHGRGAFLVPYLLMLLIEGMPLLYLELAIGQRFRKGCVGVWNHVHPFVGGLGMASVCCVFIICIYFNFVTAWVYSYIVHSFQSPLPWSECPTYITGENQTAALPECDISGPASYFWYRETLDISSGIDVSGGIRWKLLGCHLASWIILYLCVCKGIKSSGKVAYITTSLPYVVLITFLIKALTLKGSVRGIRYMFTPEISDLLDIETWLDASSQTFFSLGTSFGSLITLASYNPMNNNMHKDALLISGINFMMATFACIVTFSIVGFKATVMYDHCLDHNIDLLADVCSISNPPNDICKEYGASDGVTREIFESTFLSRITDLQNLASEKFRHCNIEDDLNKGVEGTGLIFIVYAQAIDQFGPSAPFWSLVFFLLLLSMGMGSMFGNIECLATSICDMDLHPRFKKKWFAAGIVCVPACALGLVFVQGSGFYWFELFDTFIGSYPLILVGVVESLAVGWVLGVERFSDDIEFMIGYRPNLLWKLSWKFFTPIALAVLFVGSIVFKFSEPVTYRVYNRNSTQMEDSPYPWYALLICGVLVLISLLLPIGIALGRKFGLLHYEPASTDKKLHLDDLQ